MEHSRYFYPNYSIGTDAYADVPQVCRKYGTKAVIIGGTRALKAAADRIKDAVKGSEIEITGVFEYGGEASRENMDMLNSHPEVREADMIFACGGGKAAGPWRHTASLSSSATATAARWRASAPPGPAARSGP